MKSLGDGSHEPWSRGPGGPKEVRESGTLHLPLPPPTVSNGIMWDFHNMSYKLVALSFTKEP